ncbi:MAG: metallophosphoesterase [Acidiferrobacterales bacterium]|nr:metallophosphoesterase [Acidiferrobacterales bacterium]
MTVRVVQITDVHLTAEPDSKLYGIDTALSLTNTVTAINELSIKPDVVVVTGDIAEDGACSTYIRFRDLMSGLNVPVYVLPGNHDNVSEMRSVLNTDGMYYQSHAQIGGWGILFVHTQVDGHSHGLVDPQELTRVKRDIEDLKGSPVLVALHHTPSMVCPSFGCQLHNADEFTALLDKYSNVKCVIAGHTHNASTVSAGNYIQFTTPSTFAHITHAQLGESSDHEDFWASHHLDGARQGFRVLDLSPNGEIGSDIHWLEGTPSV